MVLLDRLPLVSVVVELCCIGGECMQYRRRIGGDCMSYRRRYMSRRRRPHCATLYLHVLYPRYMVAATGWRGYPRSLHEAQPAPGPPAVLGLY